jgi:AcrR family transcriptional regulator
MPNQFREAAHQRMLEAVLDAAAVEVAARGWSGLRMRAIAEEVGISRQTLYTAFTDKHGLARALVAQRVERFLAGIEEAVAGQSDLHSRWRVAVGFTLDYAAEDPLLKSVLTADGTEEFLPLVTTDGAPILDTARARLCAMFLAAHPDLDEGELDIVAETVTRLALSHMVLPTRPNEQVAAQVAELATRFLRSTSS